MQEKWRLTKAGYYISLVFFADTMDVEDFISKYWKFKKSIAVLKSHYEIEAEESKKFREAFKRSKQEELAVLQGLIEDVESQLTACDQEIHTMKRYKDKEYPKQVVRIAQLKGGIQAEAERFQIQSLELQRMISEEERGCERQAQADLQRFQASAVQHTVKSMDGLLLKIEAKNKSMKQEILLLKQRIPQLTAEILSLKEKISSVRLCLNQSTSSAASSR